MATALAFTAPAIAQQPAQAPAAPVASPAVQAALKAADAGDPAPLAKLADAGNTEAQYYAGVMYLFGRGKIAKDPVKGCAYEQEASATRADAMHLVGVCAQTGAGGAPDKVKAEAAYKRAAQMGFGKSKCALGQMLMTEPPRAQEGLGLCRQAADAGDADAQMVVANAYFSGAQVPKDQAEARKWYEAAAKQNNLDATRRLGEMYARGDGGRKDVKKAMELWQTGEKAGDPLVSILVADQMFADMTDGRKPGPGTYAFRGGVPVADIEIVEEWYRQAQARDPRPDVQKRADYALKILAQFKVAAQTGNGVSKRR